MRRKRFTVDYCHRRQRNALATVGCSDNKPRQDAARSRPRRTGILRGQRCSRGLARDQYQSGNFDKCRSTLNEALRIDPKNARLHVLSAKLAIEQAQLETADRELRARAGARSEGRRSRLPHRRRLPAMAEERGGARVSTNRRQTRRPTSCRTSWRKPRCS